MRVVRGRRPGAREDGCPGSSHVICRRVPRQNPSAGIVGEDCSQPPDGVAETMLPQRSITSRWHVSPRVSPDGDTRGSAEATVGSPVPSAGASYAVRSGGRNAVRPGSDARPELARRRSR